MGPGHNTASAQELMAFIDRREKLEADKAAIGADVKVLNAEMAAAGFDTKIVGAVLKIRRAKPHDWQEAQALLDTYLHALGMATEPPLSRFTANASVDKASLDSICGYMEPAVPPTGGGHIDINVGGKTYRLIRDLAGDVSRTEVVDQLKQPKPANKPAAAAPGREPVPDVDADGAERLGREYAAGNRPVIDNPFPYGDPRRARFDKGWRSETGGDGMGPDEDD
jgi:uncharacterized protein (UPF0335 family)